MRKLAVAVLACATLFASPLAAQLVAGRIVRENAARRLFGGSDAIGGVGDWYLTNGVVEAVIDDAGFVPDLVARGIPVPLQNLLAPTGGTLVDVGLVGKSNDQWNQMFQISNLDPANAFFYTNVKAAASDEVATVTAEGFLIFGNVSTPSAPTLVVQTVYSVGPGDRWITVSTTVVNRNPVPVPVFNVTDAVPLSGRSLLPFVPAPKRGYSSPVLDLTPQGIASALAVFPFLALPGNISPADGVMDTVSGSTCGEVSYALVPDSFVFDPDGPAGPTAPTVQQTPALLGLSSPVVAAGGNPFDPSRSPLLPAGGSLTWVRRLLVGDRNDVAAVSNGVYTALFTVAGAPAPLVGRLTGDVDAEDRADVAASLLFEGQLQPFFGSATLPITEVRTDSTGKYAVVLPPGSYTVTVRSPERADVTQNVLVPPAGEATFSPVLSRVGSLRFQVTELGKPVPAKLTVVGVGGTRDPDFSRFSEAYVTLANGQPVVDLAPGTYGRSPALNMIFTADGKGTQAIKPGTYQVIASRGLEYTVAMKTVTVAAGQETAVSLQLERVVDSSGYVSADFHVHSGRSFDSSTPLADRVKSYAAEGVEVLVSSDHNYVLDYAPVVADLGLSPFMRSVVGNELTTSVPNPTYPQAFGHHNAFPFLVDPVAPRRGAPLTEYLSAATFYDRSRAANPGVDMVLQLNHPRAGLAGLTVIGLFNTIGFDPTKPVGGALLGQSYLGTGTTNLDFDAMEIMNGGSIGEYQQVRNDWWSLLEQGHYKVGTAVSDSHRIVLEHAGFPRSYVAAPTDSPAQLTDADVVSSVLAGDVTGTSGPFVRFSIEGLPPGSVVSKRSGPVTAYVQVEAPAWVPVEQIRVYGNGRLVKVFDGTTFPTLRPAPGDPTSSGGVVRFFGSFKLNPSADTFYVVEAGIALPPAIDTNGDGVLDTGDSNGDGRIDASDRGLVQPPSPPVYKLIAPGMVPLAFTNPIFVDRNGNGRFDAPGIDPALVPRSAPPSALYAAEPRTEGGSGAPSRGTSGERGETPRSLVSPEQRSASGPRTEGARVADGNGEAGRAMTPDVKPYDAHGHESLFPWHDLHLGPAELDLFFGALPEPARSLARCGG